ncbi:substrate-binding domain-containing protein [Streptomyces sp. NPDC047043]|uniref:substrate-binding domain-containing protein n=1 Tax=Streptomyces sp. NPDC047043 TaxID=3154497 RepID=UPI0033C93A2A
MKPVPGGIPEPVSESVPAVKHREAQPVNTPEQTHSRDFRALCTEQGEWPAYTLSTLRTVQIELPERISVLGFDDQLMAEWLDLSIVAQSPSDMGRAAADLALELINDSEADRSRHIALPHLIPRGTTAPPPTHPPTHHSEQESSGGLSQGSGPTR